MGKPRLRAAKRFAQNHRVGFAPSRLPWICPSPPPTHPLTPTTGASRCPSDLPDIRPPQGLSTGCFGVWNSLPPWLALPPPRGLCSNVTLPARAPPTSGREPRNSLGPREGAASSAGGMWESSCRGSQETLAGQVSRGLRTSHRI